MKSEREHEIRGEEEGGRKTSDETERKRFTVQKVVNVNFPVATYVIGCRF